jgi:hypothetical protein
MERWKCTTGFRPAILQVWIQWIILTATRRAWLLYPDLGRTPRRNQEIVLVDDLLPLDAS